MSTLASSMAVRSRSTALVALLLALAGCATPKVKPDADLLARQTERERLIAAQPKWQLEGRLGVSDGRDGGSGSLQWHQDGDRYQFSVHAPVTGKTWVLSGDSTHAKLEGLRDQPIGGDDASTLLERELGWHVPVSDLTSWVRGSRAKSEARIEFRGDGLPAVIEQDGWKVEYLDYDSSRQPPLPSRIFASRGDYRVRLAVKQWQ